ncbi:MAG: penicillin-binding transpeptidase domain-containing protein, partial [Planctomycetaceae bacterium]
MAALLAGWVLVLGLVGGRVAWLQTTGRDRFTSLWDRETERLETIPARNGRILTADGQVLAFDQPRYAIAVHYRWLETPPDPDWLRSQALSRLDRQDRRNRDHIATAESTVLQAREVMHAGLAQAAGLSPDELQTRFQQVQSRVERIVAAVEARRRAESDSEDSLADVSHTEPGWQGLWNRLRNELTTAPRRPRREPVVVAEELQYHEIIPSASMDVIGKIESFPHRFPGVDSRLTTERVYPQHDLAVHLIGVRTPLKPEELDQRTAVGGADPHGYRTGEPIGRMGIELACDSGLHGRSGQRRVVTNRQGEILRQTETRPPVHGQDVVLSIDSRLQVQAESLLDAVVVRGERPATTIDTMTPDTQSSLPAQPQGGCLIAIDVRTGALLAAAASPRFDNQLLVSATTSQWEAVAGNPQRPFFPRVTQAALPPGSVFKTLTAIAGIEAGVIDPAARFECRGYLERPDRERCAIFRHFGVGHGAITLEEALAQSCNVYFFDVAKRLGPDPI